METRHTLLPATFAVDWWRRVLLGDGISSRYSLRCALGGPYLTCRERQYLYTCNAIRKTSCRDTLLMSLQLYNFGAPNLISLARSNARLAAPATKFCTTRQQTEHSSFHICAIGCPACCEVPWTRIGDFHIHLRTFSYFRRGRCLSFILHLFSRPLKKRALSPPQPPQPCLCE
jgi:hypothetical protein